MWTSDDDSETMVSQLLSSAPVILVFWKAVSVSASSTLSTLSSSWVALVALIIVQK